MEVKTFEGEQIATALAQLRVKYKLTQAELGSRLGYDARTIRRYETEGTYRLDVINAYAKFFGISSLDILKGCLLFYAFSAFSILLPSFAYWQMKVE